MIERLIALVFIIILIPLLALISILIFIALGLPIFFVQKRVGIEGKEIFIIKFRTMKNVDKNKKGKDDLTSDDFFYRTNQITRFLRKFKLDEIPQLINVVLGDISFVGPRPLPLTAKNLFSKKQWSTRQNVLPGITGLSQIKGATHEYYKLRAKFDEIYVSKKKFFLDMVIVFLTILKILRFNPKIIKKILRLKFK